MTQRIVIANLALVIWNLVVVSSNLSGWLVPTWLWIGIGVVVWIGIFLATKPKENK